jgi:hypothetical protein
MSEHTYTPSQALQLLMQKLRAKDEVLATHVQAAIDAGKDIEESEPAIDRHRKSRRYRKTVPFTEEQALQVAIGALRAYFVEQPLFLRTIAANFSEVAVTTSENFPVEWNPENIKRFALSLPAPKEIEFELQVETQVVKSGDETMRLFAPTPEAIGEQDKNLFTLQELFRFD